MPPIIQQPPKLQKQVDTLEEAKRRATETRKEQRVKIGKETYEVSDPGGNGIEIKPL